MSLSLSDPARHTRQIVPLLLLVSASLSNTSCLRNQEPLDDTTEPSSKAGALKPQQKPKEVVYGLELPETMRVTRRFDDSIYLTSNLPLERVESFFRDNLLAEHVEIGPERTIFPGAQVKGKGDQRLLRVELTRTRIGTHVRLKDVTPPPVVQGLSEAERWSKVGRNLDGTVIDPLKRQ